MLNRVSCANQADRQRNSLFEHHVRFKSKCDSLQGLFKLPADFGAVNDMKLIGHECIAYFEVGPNGLEHVEHAGYIVDQGDIDGLNLRPEEKTPVGNDQRIRMPHAAQQGN